jgi:hypothetical protein
MFPVTLIVLVAFEVMVSVLANKFVVVKAFDA